MACPYSGLSSGHLRSSSPSPSPGWCFCKFTSWAGRDCRLWRADRRINILVHPSRLLEPVIPGIHGGGGVQYSWTELGATAVLCQHPGMGWCRPAENPYVCCDCSEDLQLMCGWVEGNTLRAWLMHSVGFIVTKPNSMTTEWLQSGSSELSGRKAYIDCQKVKKERWKKETFHWLNIERCLFHSGDPGSFKFCKLVLPLGARKTLLFHV